MITAQKNIGIRIAFQTNQEEPGQKTKRYRDLRQKALVFYVPPKPGAVENAIAHLRGLLTEAVEREFWKEPEELP